ncbi:MAG: DegT/DnrJ/EryC1/StrS family aminotransferase [Pseudonocardiaceae bacterium]
MIKVWDYRDEYESEKADVRAAIDEVLTSGQLVLGPKVAEFEAAFSASCDTAWGVGVNSGTDALFLALRALGVQAGDEVVTVSNTAVPTVAAIVSTGASPVFVDVDPDTYLMDVSQLKGAVSERTRCLLPVHLFGQCVDMDTVRAVARYHGLSVVEDCAQSHGARFNGEIAGSMSDLAAFSFYPTKILGGYGDGGMICGTDEALERACRRLRMYGMEGRYYAEEHGYNSRLDELHAAILLTKLARLDEYVTRRRELARLYNELLAETDLVLPVTARGNHHAYYRYVVRHSQRDAIVAKLEKEEVFLTISYPWPIHTMPAYRHFGYVKGDLPHTERVQQEIFSLPMYPSLTTAAVEMVVDKLRAILSIL